MKTDVPAFNHWCGDANIPAVVVNRGLSKSLR